MQASKQASKQASAPMTRFMVAEDLAPQSHTTLFWLGSGGIAVNARGTVLVIDPVLGVGEAGKPLLVPPPILAGALAGIDSILYTHADYDHLGPDTALALLAGNAPYYGTAYVVKTLTGLGVPAPRARAFGIGEAFAVGDVRITPTAAHHCWPRSDPYRPEDCCGFYIETPDGTVWAPGDSILLEEHLQMRRMDVLFADFSDDPYHFGRANAVKLVNTHRDAALIAYHYGTYDAPDKPAFNADPRGIQPQIENPYRLFLPAPGEPLHLRGGVLSRG